MHRGFENMRRLDAQGPASRRVVVDAEGAMLGPDCVLVRRTAAGYCCVRREEAAAIQKFLCGAEGDNPDGLFGLSRGIADALNEGQLALAQIYGLRIPIAELDSRQLKQLALTAPFIKANFNPDQPRDDHGRWADQNGGGRATVPLAVPIAATAAAAAETAASIFGAIGRTALAGLANIAARITAPTAFLGVLFLPTNSSLVGEGKVPDRPDLGYSYDQDAGVLEIFRGSDTGRQLILSDRVATDGLFHEPDGRAIGRSLGSTVVIDPDALPAPVRRSGAAARAEAESTKDRPQLCPDPSAESIAGRSERSLAYQEQISGLRRGLEVKLNSVRFDGCREEDGTMLEAKGQDMRIKWRARRRGKAGTPVTGRLKIKWSGNSKPHPGEGSNGISPSRKLLIIFASLRRASKTSSSYTPPLSTMSSEAYKLNASWRSRPEGTRACASRLASMIESLATAHPAFARWNKQAKSRPAANTPAWTMPPKIEEIAEVFERGRQYKDVPREPWPELGYIVSAWNGLDHPYTVSLAVRPGRFADCRVLPNSIDLNFDTAGPDNADLMSIAALRPAMLSIVKAWEPDCGNLVCWSYWSRLFRDRRHPTFRSGWMTYLAPQYASRVTPPAAAIVEPVAGGGMLLLATEERFSMDNPAHLAAADAIQKALDPLQEMLRPDHPVDLEHRPSS